MPYTAVGAGDAVNDANRANEERESLLQRIVDRIELPMAALGLIWLVLVILELVRGLPLWLQYVSTIIWVIFVIEFLLEFTIAPRKLTYLKRNWLPAIALLAPALRIFSLFRAFRLIRAARALRGLRLIRVLGSLNRSIGALGDSLGRHGFAYVAGFTLAVTFAGAAGMYAFERPGLDSYAEALWWTAMLMTTIASEYWPQTAEGRLLSVILSLYALGVFGYVAAALATFLVGREAERTEGELPNAKSVNRLHDEIASLREEVRALMAHLPKDEP